MAESKVKFALRISPELQKLVVDLCPRDNCQSQNEFIEKAIRFYAGFVSSQDATGFLSRAMLSVVRGIVQDSEYRLRRNLFKQAVNLGMITRVVAEYEGLDESGLTRLRDKVVRETKETDGELRLEDAVRDKMRQTKPMEDIE